MITFSNKTNNGNFNYVNEDLNINITGSYSLDESNNLVAINFQFGYINQMMVGTLNGYLNGNEMQFNISCSDFVLLNKVMSVYDEIVTAIKENNTQA